MLNRRKRKNSLELNGWTEAAMSEERTDCSPNGQATGERNERRLRAACEWSKGADR